MRKQIISLYVLISIVVCMGGCKNELPDNNNNTEINIENCSDIPTLREWAKDHKWQTEWIAGNEDENVEITINADITLPEFDSMSVVEVQYLSFTHDDKEEFLTALFDDGECYYYDDEHKTKEMWQRKIDLDINNRIILEKYFLENATSDGERDSCKSNLDNLYERKTQMEEKMKDAGNEMVRVEAFNSNPENDTDIRYQEDYYGIIDKNPYTVEVISFHGEGLLNAEDLNMEAYNLQEYIPDKLKDAINIYRTYYESVDAEQMKNEYPKDDVNQKNQCQRSMEESKQYVEKYLDRLGIPNAVCILETDMYWSGMLDENNNGNYEKRLIKDGYAFRYSFSIDNTSLLKFGVDHDYGELDSCENITAHSMDTSAYIEINDKGIINMYIDNPIKVNNVTGNVKLIPLSSVYDILKDHIDSTAKRSQLFNDLELTYFRVRNRERSGNYSFVPVWRLSNNIQSADSPLGKLLKHPILVNAIDGTIIDIVEEFTD